ncbi:MAG: T9SS type A sorting domain-containing protein [Bacteroidales bacterium]|nr:T9SS type A sorting domain-containing protein [Bacteroidales bacterium]
MKKVAFLLFVLISVINTQAQIVSEINDDTLTVVQYDTVVLYHHPDYESCSMDVWNYTLPDACFGPGTLEEYYSMLVRAIKPDVTFYDSAWGCEITYSPQDIAGSFFGKNSYVVQAYAQPFHLDSSVMVIGAAAQVVGEVYGMGKKIYVTTEKHNFEPIAWGYVYPAYLQPGNTRYSMGHYLFYNPVELKEFFIVAETYSNQSDTAKRWGAGMAYPYLNYNATFSIYDTVWKDTIIGCQGSESPWLKKDNQWVSFADDTVYTYVQNSTLNFCPIIILHPSSSALSGVSLDKTCSIFPNPTENNVTVRSNYKVKHYDLYDESGRLILSEDCNAHEFPIDLRTCIVGNYVLKIRTSKGEVVKKIIKK